MNLLLRFGTVGALGFVIDGGVLTALVELFQMNVFVARIGSFSWAMTVTWLLNRVWTFPSGKAAAKGRQYLKFAVVQIIGALINLGVFTAILIKWPSLAQHPLLPLAASAVVAFIFNYSVSKRIVFSSGLEGAG